MPKLKIGTVIQSGLPTGGMEPQRRLIADLDLTAMPERLDDAMLAEVEALANLPLPALPNCDSRSFRQALRMMLAALPRRQSDDVSGELFVEAYERQLRHLAKPQIEYLLDQSLSRCRWFPTIAECNEIVGEWRREDEQVQRRLEAANMARRERYARSTEFAHGERNPSEPLTQDEIDAMSPDMQRIGLACGALVERNGKFKAA